MQINVYSKYDSVRLELNGKEIATEQVDSRRYTARFDVPCSSGELKAIGLKDGKEVATKVLTKHSVWYGRCLIVLRPKGNSDQMTLKAEADGLESGTVIVKMQ